jgi:hypothetical protein
MMRTRRMVGRMDQRCQHDLELFIALQKVATAVVELSKQPDDILREVALFKLAGIQEEVQSLARGKVVFSATEAWRTVYERILRCADVRRYRSVAWIRNEDYWRDAPGRRSMQSNYALLNRGGCIERVLIVCDFFWPPAALLPAADICHWIDEQHNRGIWIGLVRESEIASEPDLLCDFGIYGDRAAGIWELDNQCRTVRFTLDFSQESRLLAASRWDRLALYTIPFATLLARASPSG